jgi:predicted dehydrogenase
VPRPSLAFAGSGRITIVHGMAAEVLGLPVRAVASRHAGRAAERAAQLRAEVCAYDELPAGADAVVVATPPARHVDDTVRALEAGAAVLVEKPLATTLARADDLVAADDAVGGRVLYGENLAFAPIVERAVELIAGLGPLQHLEARALQGRPDWGDFLTDGWGGGALFDLGVHPLAVVMLAAAPARVVEVAANLDGAGDVAGDEHAEVGLRFDSGLRARVVVSWRQPSAQWDLQAASADGVVRADLVPSLGLEHDGDPAPVPVMRPDLPLPQLEQFGYLHQLVALVDVVAGGRPRLGAGFGRDVLDVVCAAYASAGAGGAPEAVPFTGPRDRTPLELWRG